MGGVQMLFQRPYWRVASSSKEELKVAFGTANFEEVFAFMAEHGHLQNTGKHTGLMKGKNSSFIVRKNDPARV